MGQIKYYFFYRLDHMKYDEKRKGKGKRSWKVLAKESKWPSTWSMRYRSAKAVDQDFQRRAPMEEEILGTDLPCINPNPYFKQTDPKLSMTYRRILLEENLGVNFAISQTKHLEEKSVQWTGWFHFEKLPNCWIIRSPKETRLEILNFLQLNLAWAFN